MFLRKVMWVGLATTFCVGLAVAVGVGTAALAAVPGDPFKLGRLNTVGRVTSLAGGVAGPLLKLDNNGGGPVLDLESEAGRSLLTVNVRAGKATNRDADRSTARTRTGSCATSAATLRRGARRIARARRPWPPRAPIPGTSPVRRPPNFAPGAFPEVRIHDPA